LDCRRDIGFIGGHGRYVLVPEVKFEDWSACEDRAFRNLKVTGSFRDPHTEYTVRIVPVLEKP
jgi:hypothetical protein